MFLVANEDLNHFSGVLFAMTFVKGTNTKFTRGDFSWNCSRDVWGGQSDGFRMIRVRLGSREGYWEKLLWVMGCTL